MPDSSVDVPRSATRTGSCSKSPASQYSSSWTPAKMPIDTISSSPSADQHGQVDQPAHHRVARVLLQLPQRPLGRAQVLHPADPGDDQAEQGDQPDLLAAGEDLVGVQLRQVGRQVALDPLDDRLVAAAGPGRGSKNATTTIAKTAKKP